MAEDPQQSIADMDKSPELEENWSSVNFTCSTLLKKADLMSGTLQLTLSLGNGVVLSCNMHLLEMADPPAGLKSLADLDLINAETFNLI